MSLTLNQLVVGEASPSENRTHTVGYPGDPWKTIVLTALLARLAYHEIVNFIL
jgi:hypothetical protein